MRRRAGKLPLLLLTSGLGACFVATEPFEVPSPDMRGTLETRLQNDSTDIDASIALSVMDLELGRVSDVSARLEPFARVVPADPVVPLLLGLAEERRDGYASARDHYRDYVSRHRGPLSEWALLRWSSIRGRALREDGRRLVQQPLPPISSAEYGRVLVLPFAHESTEADVATAVSSLLTRDLDRGRWTTVDARRTRLLVEASGVESSRLDELGAGIRLARMVRARRVVQITPVRPTPDSLRWDITLTTLASGNELDILRISLAGESLATPSMLRSTTVRLHAALEGRPPQAEQPSLHTESLPALAAFGRAERALDRDDPSAAHRELTTALELDPSFVHAERLRTSTAVVAALPSTPSEAELVEIVRLGERQRALSALLEGPGASALRAVGADRRSLLVDVLGLDRFEAGAVVDLLLTPGSLP